MLRAAQGCSGSEQSCTATAQGCLFIAQGTVTCDQVSKWKWNLERSRFGCEYSGISTPNSTQSYFLFWSSLTKHFLAGSTSAQALLTLHRHCSVLMSFAHPRAQTPSKCCSGCSPSAHPCLVPFFVPYHDWIPGPCPYLSSLEFGQVYAMFCQGPIWGSLGPETMPSPKTGHSVSQ
jgi:hypothetical protein